MEKLITRCKIEWLEQEGCKGYTINPFIGCGYGCYKGHCWAYLTAKRQGRVATWDQWQRPRINPKFQGIPIAVEIQREALRLPENARVLLSAMCDPFQFDFFGYNSIVEKILVGICRASNHPQLWVLTKSGEGIIRFMPELQECDATVGITLPGLEKTEEWEPHASSPILRMLALKKAKEARFRTYISIEPWIPEITEPKAIIEATRQFTDSYILGSFNYAGVDSGYYREHLPPLLDWLERESINFYLKKELKAKAADNVI